MSKQKGTRLGHMHYDIMRRCYNSNYKLYKDYGAKGITVCDEWHIRENFVNWAWQNGFEKGLRLQRIDSSKGYSPDNCYFGTKYKKQEGGYNQYIHARAEFHKKLKALANIDGAMSEEPLYEVYRSMHTRCENPNNTQYHNYGGRGIKVCEEWSGKYGFLVFKTWSDEAGYQRGLTLDRIDVNGNYEPSNCRWATWEIQGNNRRNTRYIEFENQQVPFSMFVRQNGLNYNKAQRLYYKGYNGEQILAKIG